MSAITAALPEPQAPDPERGAAIIGRTLELMGQGLGWSKAMAQARAEADDDGDDGDEFGDA